MSKNDDLEYGHELNKYLAETHERRRSPAVRTSDRLIKQQPQTRHVCGGAPRLTDFRILYRHAVFCDNKSR